MGRLAPKGVTDELADLAVSSSSVGGASHLHICMHGSAPKSTSLGSWLRRREPFGPRPTMCQMTIALYMTHEQRWSGRTRHPGVRGVGPRFCGFEHVVRYLWNAPRYLVSMLDGRLGPAA